MNGKGGIGDHLMKSLDEITADQREKGGKPEKGIKSLYQERDIEEQELPSQA